MAIYTSSFTKIVGTSHKNVLVGPNFDVQAYAINGGSNSPAFYIEVDGNGVGLTESQMKEIFEGFLKTHDYYTEHGVSFE